METQAPTRGRVAIMALFALSCFGLLLYLWNAFGGPIPLHPHGYRFSVEFNEAAQLAPEADVRVSGVTIGHVKKIETAPGRTRTVIEIDSRYAPVRSDARAILRQKTLLGETYIEMTPGSRRAPAVPEGGSLASRQVGATVELDEVLRAFDRPTRAAFKTWVTSWAKSLDGRGQDISDSLGNLAPTVQDAASLTQVLDSQRSAVTRLVRDSGKVFSAIGRHEGAVRSLITAGDAVLSTTAARNRELTQTIQILPTFLRELRPTLAEAELTAAAAGPVVHDLRPAGRRLAPTLRSLSALAPDLRALFREIDPLIAVSRTALPAATRTVRAAIPLVRVVYPIGRDLVPVADYLGVYREEFVTMLANVASATQAGFAPPGDRFRSYLRALTPLTNEGFVTYPHRFASNRHNPYFAPRGLAKLAGGLEAFDCANVGNSQPVPVVGSGAPPCVVQKPPLIRGRARAFPHLERDGP